MARLAPLRKVRLTGGEPLLRVGLPALVHKLRRLLPRAELAMTTNGTRLRAAAVSLRDHGLDTVNISLDTADPAHFARLTGGGSSTACSPGSRPPGAPASIASG